MRYNISMYVPLGVIDSTSKIWVSSYIFNENTLILDLVWVASMNSLRAIHEIFKHSKTLYCIPNINNCCQTPIYVTILQGNTQIQNTENMLAKTTKTINKNRKFDY